MKLATMLLGASVVLGIAGCSSGPDCPSCPTFDVTKWCDQHLSCTVDGKPFASAQGQLPTLAAGQTLVIPIGDLGAGVASFYGSIDVGFDDPIGMDASAPGIAPGSKAAAVLLDGVPGSYAWWDGGMISRFTWNPFPAAPKQLAIRFAKGRPTNVQVYLVLRSCGLTCAA